jgi:hypothetical protein
VIGRHRIVVIRQVAPDADGTLLQYAEAITRRELARSRLGTRGMVVG